MASKHEPTTLETDLHPREFGAALVMAATWYFAGPWGIVPTLWFLYMIVKEKPTWIAQSGRLLPVSTRRALTARAQVAGQTWRQLTAPWREEEGGNGRLLPVATPDPRWIDADPLSETLVAEEAELPLSLVTVDELAAAQNILIVGSPGSGKSTLLHALIARRRWRCYVLDPHNHPGKWPGGANVIGGGRGFQAIYAALQRAEAALDSRAKQLNASASARFAPFTLAGDEWGSVCSEISVPKDEDPPGRLLTRLLKEGRKFKISFLGAAHGDTAASLGSSGDTAAFRYSFDAIVYMGGFVAQQLKDMPEIVRQLPMGRTPEGKRFPLIVVVFSPITGERRLLDLRGIEAATPAPAPTQTAPLAPLTPTPAPVTTPALATAVADGQTDELEEAMDRAPTPLSIADSQTAVTQQVQSREDLVRLLVRQGWTVSQIREVVKGDNTTLGMLVRRIEDELLNERS